MKAILLQCYRFLEDIVLLSFAQRYRIQLVQDDSHRSTVVQVANQSPSSFVSNYLADCMLVQILSFAVLT